MSTQWQPQESCVICGEDCSGRLQDRKGRYYCTDCYEQARQRDEGANAGGLVGFIASPMGVGLGVLVVIAVVALSLGDVVTGLFFLLVGLAALNGYWIGASRISAVFGGMFVAALIAVPLGKALEGVISAALGSTGLTNRMISIAVLAMA